MNFKEIIIRNEYRNHITEELANTINSYHSQNLWRSIAYIMKQAAEIPHTDTTMNI